MVRFSGMASLLTRRQAIQSLAAARLALAQDLGAASNDSQDVPSGVTAIIRHTLKQSPELLNTDWFGTVLMKGLLDWGRHGFPETREFAWAWLEYHLGRDRVAPFSGARTSRVVRAGGIPITTYCGHFGLSLPCYEMATQFGDRRARQVCLDIGAIILHQCARNHLGMVIHDDYADFTIPDVCYFVVTPLIIASSLDQAKGWVYRDQAIYQLRTYIDVFLVKETGLAKTILLKTGLGKTYWSRASGWLLWAITGMLRYLPRENPHFARFQADLSVLAKGIARWQDPSGGVHLFIDDPHSPLETSGTVMCALGLHEAVRKRWLPESFMPVANHAWAFARQNLTAEGDLHNVYTGWAVPAEAGKVEMDQVAMGWIPGFVLSAASELSNQAR